MNLTIHVDGGSRGNPGPAGAGVLILDSRTSAPLHEAGYFLGRCTNNVAEYTGLLRALQIALTLAPARVDIRADSELMVRQINGQYRVKSPDLKPLFEKVGLLLRQFPAWGIEHVYREENGRADELANLAMDQRRDVIVNAAPGIA